MSPERDWLWDRKITIKKAAAILRDPEHERFVSLAGLLLSRKNTPKEVFKDYIKPLDFFRNWQKIKRQMRKDRWNDPRIEFWQAIYEKIREKYQGKKISVSKELIAKTPEDAFCKVIADKIKMIRKQKGLTQRQLAKRLEVSQQIISRIESGRENISLLTLKKIIDSLGVGLHLDIS